MGLINWLKNKYYDYKLGKADSLSNKGDIEKATLVYESLLGKQSMAVVHFGRMLISNASDVQQKLSVLPRLESLNDYENEVAKSEFTSIILSHVSSMERLALSQFNVGKYSDAVNLQKAIGPYRSGKEYHDSLSRYKAFLAFVADSNRPLNVDGLYCETASLLRGISAIPVSDIKKLQEILEKEKYFGRAIKLLVQLLWAGTWVKESILQYIVEVISANDKELKSVRKFREICRDEVICKESAVDLAIRAKSKAKSKDYKTAVLYDSFASELLSGDNAFNFERVKHILEELSGRADSKEINALLELAQTLKLSESQIKVVKTRINEIAIETTSDKAIAICRLFIGEKSFDKVYLEKSLSLAKSGQDLNIPELRKVISNQTTVLTRPDAIGPFVVYIPIFEDEFISDAIKALKENKTPERLDRYWKIKADNRLLEAILNSAFDSDSSFLNHFVSNHSLYLDQASHLRVFTKLLIDNYTLETALRVFESLLSQKVKVDEEYVKFIISSSKKVDSEEGVDLINRGLSHIQSQLLVDEKKAVISKLIKGNRTERAEKEIEQLVNDKDFEAPTLLAELYYHQSARSFDNIQKSVWLIKILDLDDTHEFLNRFQDSFVDTLDTLVKVAESLYEQDNSGEAYRIANRILVYKSHWLRLYLTLRDKECPDGTLNDKIKYDLETLQVVADSYKECKEDKEVLFENVWNRYLENVIKKAKSQPKLKAIESLSSARDKSESFATVKVNANLGAEVYRLIIKLKWEAGLEAEYEGRYSEAVKLYVDVAKSNQTAYSNRAKLRYAISSLKANEVDSSLEDDILTCLSMRSYQAMREDLAYRYALYLLKRTRPQEAQRILDEFLPEEKELKQVCKNKFIKAAEEKLETLNTVIKKLNAGKMSVAEAVEFKQALREYKKEIGGQLSDIARQFNMMPPMIEGYILHKMFEEEQYQDVLNKLMQENPNYVENDTDFRNIAVASLGLIESNISDESVLKRAIATVLTAIYTDRLFVKSLDYTSWDDKYDFTLDESLGKTGVEDYEELPENVNFNTAVENSNVSIRDVQNNLLTRVETSIRKYHPHLESFFADEKAALDNILGLNLDKEFILASPHLCRTLASLRISIENALEYELQQDYGNHEEVLALGVDYGFNGGGYDEFRKGWNALLFCKNSISTNSNINSAFGLGQVSAIRKFNRLWSDLKSWISTKMNEDIRQEMDFKSFLNKYEHICRMVKDNALSLTCSNYVNGKVVHLLNSDKMELREGVGYMVRLYNIAPNNEQIKNNLEGTLNNLVHKTEKDNRSADRNALRKALADLNGSFNDKIALTTIIAQVNNDRIEEATALSQLYDLYLRKNSDAEICEALSTLVKICIHKYIMTDSYSRYKSNVREVLNKLKVNRSSTFKESAKILAAEYVKILKQLPRDAQLMIMAGISLPGQSLNSKGLALKAGMDYLKSLGGVDELMK